MFQAGFDMADHLKHIKARLEEIEDPKDYVNCALSVHQAYLPYVAKKQGEVSNQSNSAPVTTIQIMNYQDPNLTPTLKTSSTVVTDVTPLPLDSNPA